MSATFPSKARGAAAGPKAAEKAVDQVPEAKKFPAEEAAKAAAETSKVATPAKDDAAKKPAPSCISTPTKDAATEGEKVKSPLTRRFSGAIGKETIDADAEGKKIESMTWENIFQENTDAFRPNKRKWTKLVGPYQSSSLYRTSSKSWINRNGQHTVEAYPQNPKDYDTNEETTEGEPPMKKLKLTMVIHPQDYFLDEEGAFREELFLTFLAANGSLHRHLDYCELEDTYTALSLKGVELTDQQFESLAWALRKGLPVTSLQLDFANPAHQKHNYSLIQASAQGGNPVNVQLGAGSYSA